MKFFESFALLVGALATVQAHNMMSFPKPRGDPNNPNTAKPDGNCIMSPLNDNPGCGARPFPCGGYPADKQVTQEFAPGQVFNVKFFNLNNPPPEGDQARHNGGLCEFALSYDGGNKWSKIATYHRTCPDMFYEWPVKIPSNAPAGNCVFSWSWINALGNREFYQNCADIKITGDNGGSLPETGITVANLPGFPTMTPEGDPANTGNSKGSGPSQDDIQANTAGGDAAPAGGDAPASDDPKTGDAPTSDPTASDDPTTGDAPTSDAPTSDPTASGDPTTGTQEPGRGPGKTAGGSGSSASDGAPCDQDGQYVCADPDQSSEYFVCNHGQFVSLSCSDGRICHTSEETMIVCG